MGQSESFSIRQVMELTGLSEFTLRGWECRYSAFRPRRGETGRRKYSRNDIERALLLRELLKQGHKIGKIARLSIAKLRVLFAETEVQKRGELIGGNSQAVSKILELTIQQRWEELDLFIREYRGRNAKDLVSEFFLPVLHALSIKVDLRKVSVAQEHIVSSLIKEKIYSALSFVLKAVKSTPSKARFVLATPEGDYHEMGLLLGHLLIRIYGFTSLYLGPHTPAKELAETAIRFKATHVLIVSTVSKKEGASQSLLSYVSDVQKKVGSHLRILIAGSQRPALDEHPLLLSLESFEAFEEYLGQLKKTLA